ncbi:MAG: hypothetical protein JOZ25_04490 [Actinobacteria bacterium]|nr:hypothetical protein [Actinomycetota bacterium]
MRRLMGSGLVATAALLAAVPIALAQTQNVVSGYDGTNPFACTLQEVGQGTNFPEPNADPFCVEYDKRHQNIDKLGVVDFLSKEPARVAAASPKCFYFQRDHWRGYVSESQPATQTYAWDGSYFFDKARGLGGAYVENVSFAHQSGDPTQIPGFPDEYRPYFSNGRGGVQKTGDIPVDPNCVKKFQQHDPRAGGGPGGAGVSHGCRVPGGRVGHGIGGIGLHSPPAKVRGSLGPPSVESARFMGYCMTGGGRLAAAFGKSGPAGKVVLVMTNATPFDWHGIRTGTKTSDAKRRLHGIAVVSARGLRLLMKPKNGYTAVFGIAHRHVTFVATVKPALSVDAVAKLVRAAPR